MKLNQTRHLSDAELKALLSVEPNDKNLSDIEHHLEQCLDCQTRLNQAAAEPWWWGEGQDLFSSSVPRTDDFIRSGDDLSQESEMIPTHEKSAAAFDLVDAQVAAIVDLLQPPTHPELLGQIDGYQVEKLIGVGGMGVVFKAFDSELNRSVAIKFLLPSLAKVGVARQRFAREAKAAAAVCHENVIPIFRIKSNWTYPFFVMPYIGGQSLEQLIKSEGALEATQLVQIAHQIADGLAAAHSLGLIHRDIKPGNILLSNELNRVVITDFGLVRDEGDHGLTQTGEIAGTPNYMSPEQATGQRLDGRSDLFSLGGVMYWMATGRRPFSGNNQYEVLNNLQHVKSAPIRSINPGVPAELESVIVRLLEKNPGDRFTSASELTIYLNKYSAHLHNPIENHRPRLSAGGSLWEYGFRYIKPTVAALLCLFIGYSLFAMIVNPAYRPLAGLFAPPQQQVKEDVAGEEMKSVQSSKIQDPGDQESNGQITQDANKRSALDIPDRVRKAATKLIPGVILESATQTVERDNIVYILKGKKDDGTYLIKVDDSGHAFELVMSFEECGDDPNHAMDDQTGVELPAELIRLDDVPAHVKAGVKKLVKNLTFKRAKKATRGEETVFIIFGVADGEQYKIKVDSKGQPFEFQMTPIHESSK